jgi:hypothetical protein
VKDKEVKLEEIMTEIEASLTLGGAGEGRVQGRTQQRAVNATTRPHRW